MYEKQYGAETQEYLSSTSSLRPNDKSNATSGTDHKPRLPMYINGIGAQTLAEMTLSEPEWLVDKLLCTESLCVLASAPKAGKSYLALQLGHAVSTGTPFFGYETRKASVLYLALEDRFNRVRHRLWSIADELSDDFEIETKILELGNGLIDELDEYIARKPDTKLFIIDTLQVVRGEGNDCHYSSDYGDIRKLKAFSDEHKVCLLVLTHLRKMFSKADVFTNITGTNGISGASDQMMVLRKKKRTAPESILDITGRDVPDTRLKLRRNNNGLWELIESFTDEELTASEVPDCIKTVTSYILNDAKQWSGTTSELRDSLGLDGVTVPVLGKFLAQHADWMREHGVEYSFKRTSAARTVTLTPVTEIDPADTGSVDIDAPRPN